MCRVHLGLGLLFVVDTDSLLIPLIEAVYAFVYLDGMVPAQPVQLAHVGEFEHSAVGFGAVPA